MVKDKKRFWKTCPQCQLRQHGRIKLCACGHEFYPPSSGSPSHLLVLFAKHIKDPEDADRFQTIVQEYDNLVQRWGSEKDVRSLFDALQVGGQLEQWQSDLYGATIRKIARLDKK